MTTARAIPSPSILFEETPRTLRNCLAPAKLNLFLHITGRRSDGYHALQSVFQLLAWGDTLHFTLRADSRLVRTTDVAGVPTENDLVMKAAALLKAHAGSSAGADIEIHKCVPIGGGLGGGSSDAATTLLALNRLWKLNAPRGDLHALAAKLGADVPFFIFGKNAFVEGIGETLRQVELPARWFLIVTPPTQVPTAAIFSEKSLTRDSKSIKISDFIKQRSCLTGWPDSYGRNDMQPVVMENYAEVARVIKWFHNVAPARMTGSGASVFATFCSSEDAKAVQASLPTDWKSVVTTSLDTHPLFTFAS